MKLFAFIVDVEKINNKAFVVFTLFVMHFQITKGENFKEILPIFLEKASL